MRRAPGAQHARRARHRGAREIAGVGERVETPALLDDGVDLMARQREHGLVDELLGELRVVEGPVHVAEREIDTLTVSFDDYVITSMVAGVDSETLPMVVYAMARRGASPVINAISAVIVVVFGTLILVSERMTK